jgi:hypothetical protein
VNKLFLQEYTTRREIPHYPICEKVLMWINMQWKIALKMEGDSWESIIYTAKK